MLRDGSFFGYGNPKLGKGSEYVRSGKWATLHLLLFSENIQRRVRPQTIALYIWNLWIQTLSWEVDSSTFKANPSP